MVSIHWKTYVMPVGKKVLIVYCRYVYYQSNNQVKRPFLIFHNQHLFSKNLATFFVIWSSFYSVDFEILFIPPAARYLFNRGVSFIPLLIRNFFILKKYLLIDLLNVGNLKLPSNMHGRFDVTWNLSIVYLRVPSLTHLGAAPFIVPSTPDSHNSSGAAQNRVTWQFWTVLAVQLWSRADRTDTWFQYGGRCCHALSMCQLQGITCRINVNMHT